MLRDGPGGKRGECLKEMIENVRLIREHPVFQDIEKAAPIALSSGSAMATKESRLKWIQFQQQVLTGNF